MKKLFISLAFIFISLFIIDRIGGNLMWHAYQNTYSTTCYKTREVVNNVNQDVLILGSSRCAHHYVPSIISDSIGMSVYNGGFNGACIYSYYMVLNYILAHYTPKIVCLDLITSDYTLTNDPFKSIHIYAPYVGQNKGADEVFIADGSYWKYQLSHLYRYNSLSLSIFSRLAVRYVPDFDNGYYPITDPHSYPTILSASDTPNNIDPLKIQYLHKFINLCKTHDIRLVFIISPSYTIASTDEYKPLQDIAKEYDIPFLDYHTKKTFIDHPEYFKDASHLWEKGAKLYSRIVSKDLKRIMAQ